MKKVIQFRELLIRLAWKEIRVRYKEPILGFIWALLVPLSMTLIFMFIFTKIVKVPFKGYPFFIFLATGLFPWNFFSLSVSTSTMSILESGSLIKKVYFPREIIPISIVFANAIIFLFTLIPMIFFILISGIKLTLWMALLPVAFVLQIVFTSGVCLMISGLQVSYRDIKYIVEIILPFWFYITPIFYPLELVLGVSTRLFSIYILNPMVGLVTMYRIALLGNTHIANLLPNINIMIIFLYSVIFSGLFFWIGFYVFKKHEPTFPDLVK